MGEVKRIIERFSQVKVLIIGDVMLDAYVWGGVERVSPEAPVPIVLVRSESLKLGGAANVAYNIKALGAKPVLIGVVGDDREGRQIRSTLEEAHIEGSYILRDDSRHTTTKTRIIAHQQQVVRVDRENSSEIKDEIADRVLDVLKKGLNSVQGVIISDYGKGTLRPDIVKEAISLARVKGIFVAVDPTRNHSGYYKGATLLTPNRREAEDILGHPIEDEESLKRVGWDLQNKVGIEALLITLGEEGMALFEPDQVFTHFPTVAKEVYDVTGAGDTVVSTFAVSKLAGASFQEAARLSNHAAGIVIGGIGTRAVTRETLLDDLNRLSRDPEGKGPLVEPIKGFIPENN